MTTHVALVSAVIETTQGSIAVPVQVCAAETKDAAKTLAEGAIRDVGSTLQAALACQLVGPMPGGGMGTMMPAGQFLALLGIRNVRFVIAETEAKTSNIVAPRLSLV